MHVHCISALHGSRALRPPQQIRRASIFARYRSTSEHRRDCVGEEVRHKIKPAYFQNNKRLSLYSLLYLIYCTTNIEYLIK